MVSFVVILHCYYSLMCNTIFYIILVHENSRGLGLNCTSNASLIAYKNRDNYLCSYKQSCSSLGKLKRIKQYPSLDLTIFNLFNSISIRRLLVPNNEIQAIKIVQYYWLGLHTHAHGISEAGHFRFKKQKD